MSGSSHFTSPMEELIEFIIQNELTEPIYQECRNFRGFKLVHCLVEDFRGTGFDKNLTVAKHKAAEDVLQKMKNDAKFTEELLVKLKKRRMDECYRKRYSDFHRLICSYGYCEDFLEEEECDNCDDYYDDYYDEDLY